MPNFLFLRGMPKPPLGAQVDREHPMALNWNFTLPLNDINNQLADAQGPSLLFGNWNTVGLTVPDHQGTASTWVSSTEGPGLRFVTGNNRIAVGGVQALPVDRATYCLIHRKTDTTNRASSAMGVWTGTETQRGAMHLPWSDGVVYWDWGGFTSGTSRVAVSGLSFAVAPAAPDRYVFRAGPRGMAVFQNGKKVGSHTTAAASRTGSGFQFTISAGSSDTSDECDFFFVHVVAEEWSDDLCLWWSAEPYAMFYQPVQRLYFDFGSILYVPTVTNYLPSGGYAA